MIDDLVGMTMMHTAETGKPTLVLFYIVQVLQYISITELTQVQTSLCQLLYFTRFTEIDRRVGQPPSMGRSRSRETSTLSPLNRDCSLNSRLNSL